jgi:hypothetical protein
MTKEEVLAKVAKLFELSNSSNENEAALAASKARELLSRYNLTVADLPSEEMRSVICATETSLEVGKVLKNWVKALLIHVAGGFDCEHIIRRRRAAEPVLTFIGTAADAEVALHTFIFLHRELNRFADKALPRLKRENRSWNTTSLRYAYLDGAVRRIGERLREETRALRQAEQNDCRALVLAKRQIIGDYMAKTFSNIRTEYARRRMVSIDAFEKGYADAGAISLRPALTDAGEDKFAVTA